MNWINIHTETLRGEEFIGAEPVERATWLTLLGWCCAQENDGVINDCKDWKSRKWQQLCGVTKSEVETISELYAFEGENLVVSFYPTEQQAAVKAKREAGKKGGRPRRADPSKPLQGKEVEPHGLSELKGSNNEKERKVIVKERKEKELAESAAIAWTSAGGWSGINTNDKVAWLEAYPACDIDRQLASANQWLLSNPSKAKKKLWRKFITGWLSRQQERGGDIASNKSKPQSFNYAKEL